MKDWWLQDRKSKAAMEGSWTPQDNSAQGNSAQGNSAMAHSCQSQTSSGIISKYSGWQLHCCPTTHSHAHRLELYLLGKAWKHTAGNPAICKQNTVKCSTHQPEPVHVGIDIPISARHSYSQWSVHLLLTEQLQMLHTVCSWLPGLKASLSTSIHLNVWTNLIALGSSLKGKKKKTHTVDSNVFQRSFTGCQSSVSRQSALTEVANSCCYGLQYSYALLRVLSLLTW